MKDKIGIIINPNHKINLWQYQCILKLKNKRITFLIAKEIKSDYTKEKRLKFINNFFYYFINIIAIQQKKTKVKFEEFDNFQIEEIFFNTNSKGWAELIDDSIENIKNHNFRFIYKCGMSLLKLNKNLKVPILSHHHGDPSKFRGRPAGFYEILKKHNCLGQMVQIISNELDSGKILAYGETNIYSWSYKKTLKEAYDLSPIILEKALFNYNKNFYIRKKSKGKIYKLPSNIICFQFILLQILNFSKRIIYGIFYEKAWGVKYSKIKNINHQKSIFKYLDKRGEDIFSLKKDPKYYFYADPFFLDSNIIVEGLSKKKAKGELLIVDSNKNIIIKKIKHGRNHLSYPYTLKCPQGTFIYPDSYSFKKPILYLINNDNIECIEMNRFSKSLSDPSVILYEDNFYLFANYSNEPGILRLWISKTPFFDKVIEHPSSPISISPRGGRMGGRIFYFDKIWYRLGQDCSSDYGNGLILYKIKKLSINYYIEEEIDYFKYDMPLKGPHNIDIYKNIIVWDYYEERFNLLAGFKRLYAKI